MEHGVREHVRISGRVQGVCFRMETGFDIRYSA